MSATVRLPRELHPVAWWIWAVGIAAAASFTTNPFALLLMVAAVAWVVAARRGDHPWARSFRIYLWFGLAVVALRVVFRVLLSGGMGTVVWFELPAVPLPDWVAGVTLLGPVTRESVLAGLYEGMRLATIIICVGAANSLANPKRLLKSVPPALYEVGTAIVVAVTVVPQLADSVRRVRRARSLRGSDRGRVRGLRRIVVPVLEDALSRSLRLAAGMDTRGYGRAGQASPAQRRLTGTLMLGGLVGLCVGVYAVLDQTAPRYLAMPMVVLGSVVALAGFVSAGRRVRRTRYRPDRWRPAELAVAACGVALATAMVWLARNEPMVAYPDLLGTPVVSALMLAAILLAAVPGVLAPPAPTGAVKPA
ncbi:energy-coupling factor transport system permease protein [Nocardioides massiliensis]|uniref:Energy-coupling factor transport system permease protein n=2 Tax=Nocardioides massiliensis TaxID=1325935 RepID=A0ABT9NTK9_9ACTN|nr:CbiQ family ECF transporter T component [Nocardioides massiliensis]MDP9823763.1 energy-coupling factor transport system permease protein [Nocardioides massiliensis]